MKKLFLMVIMCLVTFSMSSCNRASNALNTSKGDENTIPEGKRKILVVYFSWGGTTKRVAEEIITRTGADVFRIEPVTPYPTEYTSCTEVAKIETDKGIRPPIKGTIENFDQYDTVFIGCPVWWHTAPMII